MSHWWVGVQVYLSVWLVPRPISYLNSMLPWGGGLSGMILVKVKVHVRELQSPQGGKRGCSSPGYTNNIITYIPLYCPLHLPNIHVGGAI